MAAQVIIRDCKYDIKQAQIPQENLIPQTKGRVMKYIDQLLLSCNQFCKQKPLHRA